MTNLVEAQSNQDTEHSYKPALHECLKLSLEVAAEWKSIGVFLDVSVHNLECIEKERGKCTDCLREMLIEWHKQPHPTWKQLAEAVKMFNPKLAETILAQQQ